MRTETVIFIMYITAHIQELFGEKELLQVSVLLEATQHGLSKYFALFPEILELVFEDVENRMDILPEYSLKLIPKDTQVTPFFCTPTL